MVRWLKLGTAAKLKIKYNGKRALPLSVMVVWLFSIFACSQGYVAPAQLTATAVRMGIGGAMDTTPVPPAQTLPPNPETEAAQTQSAVENPVQSTLPASSSTELPPILYYAQAGDTLPAVAVRFGVQPEEITSPAELPAHKLMNPGQLMVIPNRLSETGPGVAILPDSEVVFSPSAVSFDIDSFVLAGGGYLSTYKEYLSNGWNSGADVIMRVANENSINPRLLLAVLEEKSHWVYGQPTTQDEIDYPMGFIDPLHPGLFKQASLAVQQLCIGYYGWRYGLLTDVTFKDKSTVRLAPGLNAGSAAIQLLYSKIYDDPETWSAALSGDQGLPILHERMFGNPWLRAQSVEPLYPPNLEQPVLELPFKAGQTWSLTGGPHSAWGPDGALAAIDLAPSSAVHGCYESEEWVTASASGLVVRSGGGAVLVDLDGDGFEQTGWVILYMHIATKDRITVGTWVNTNDPIGHPSCEGGNATGTHTHIARKYNGEWILADGPLPFVLGGYITHAGSAPYEGSMTAPDGHTVEANFYGTFSTHVVRSK
jgi:LysM repeat protein